MTYKEWEIFRLACKEWEMLLAPLRWTTFFTIYDEVGMLPMKEDILAGTPLCSTFFTLMELETPERGRTSEREREREAADYGL